jgi:hypothetical protein
MRLFHFHILVEGNRGHVQYHLMRPALRAIFPRSKPLLRTAKLQMDPCGSEREAAGVGWRASSARS